MQQTIAERVQIMAAQTVSPQTLKSKFWGRQEREGCERSLGWSKSHILGACEDSRRRQKGENQEDGGRGRNGGGGGAGACSP